jgi:hypothetical protein
LASRIVEKDDGGEDQAKITWGHLVHRRETSDPMEMFAEQFQGGLMGRGQPADPFGQQPEGFFT